MKWRKPNKFVKIPFEKYKAIIMDLIVLGGHSPFVFQDILADILLPYSPAAQIGMGVSAAITGKIDFHDVVFDAGVVEHRDHNIVMLLMTGVIIISVEMVVSLLDVRVCSDMYRGFIGGVFVVHAIMKQVPVSVDDILGYKHVEQALVVIVLLSDLFSVVDGSHKNDVLLLLLLPLSLKLLTFFLDLGRFWLTHQHDEPSGLCC